MSGNVLLIDPNNESDNTNHKMINGIPQYQDMYIFAELVAKSRGRSVIVSNNSGLYSLDRNSSINDISINFMGNNQDNSPDNPNYLKFTTNWYDGSSAEGKQFEGFGISSIKVTINSSFIPQVNIQFIDLRGLAFFNQENSPYRVLFNFPPPIFYLTIKGYYGLPLSYQLHLVKYTTEFKSENGNFVIDAQFIAMTYAPLTDVLFRYVVNFPLMQDTIPSNPSPGVPPVNIYDLILKIKSLNTQLPSPENNTAELIAYQNAIKNRDEVDLLITTLNGYATNPKLENNIPLLFTGIQSFNVAENTGNMILTPITSINDYNSTIQSVPTNGISNNTANRLLIGYLVSNSIMAKDGVAPIVSNLFTADYLPPDSSADSPPNTSIVSKLITLKNYREDLINSAAPIVSEGDIPLPTPVSNILNNNINTYALLDITTYYEKLYKKKTELQERLVTTTTAINTSINNTVLKTLGMNPTIYNVFKIICDDVDKFFNILRETSYSAESDYNVRNRKAILSGDYQDVINTINPDSTKIFAFPLIIDKQTMSPCQVKETRIAPVKLGIAIGETFPEIKLVNEFIKTFVTQRNLTAQYDMRIAQNADGTSVWIPISPVDSKLGTTNTVSPYYGIDTSDGGKTSQSVNGSTLPPVVVPIQSSTNLSTDTRVIQVFKIVLKRFYILTQNTFPYKFYEENNSYVSLFSQSEAINLAISMFNPEYVDLILEFSKRFNGKPEVFYDFIRTDIPELYKFTQTERQFFNILDGSNLTYSITKLDDDGDIYVNKNNLHFRGFKIHKVAIIARPKEATTDNSDSPISTFLDTNAQGWWKNLWKGTILESTLKFTTENVIFISDDNPNSENVNIKNQTRFLSSPFYLRLQVNYKGYTEDLIFFVGNSALENRIQTIDGINNNTTGNQYFIDNLKEKKGVTTYFNSINTVWAEQLAILLPITYETIINVGGNDYDKYLSALMILSSFGYALSPFNVYPSQLNTTIFSIPAAIETPSFLSPYMGALVGIYPGDPEYNKIYNFFVNGAGRSLSSSGALIFADIIDINNQLAESDKAMLKTEYTNFFESGILDDIVNALKILYLKVNASNPTTDEKRIAYTKELNPTDTSAQFFYDILQPLMEKHAIINFSQITFKRNAVINTGYTSININNNISAKKIINDKYFNGFFQNLIHEINDKKRKLKKQKEEDDKLAGDEDIITQTYYSFKNINDKWLASPKSINRQIGYPFNEDRTDNGIPHLIDLFAFVDRAMNPIGNTMINPEILIDLLNDPNVSVFTVFSQLLSMNNFLFFPLQNFMSYENNEWKNSFNIDTTGTVKAKPAYVCMYMGGSSSYPTGIETFGGQFKDDGITDISNPGVSDFNAKDCPQIPDDDNQKATNPEFPWGQVRAFRVRFGEQNQSMFKDIKIDSKEYPETNESIKILARLAGDNKLQAPTPKGQNLYNMYENRSYRATVTGLGNAMIQPTQYFQVENVPLFNGAYVILGVEHNILPNNMTTSFYGTKILKYPIPRVLQPSVIYGYGGGNTNNTNPNASSATGVKTGKQAITISTARLSNSPAGLDAVFGIDVSKHQGAFDWEKAVQNSIVNPGDPKLEFAIIKISQDTYHTPDVRGKRNANEAKRVGLKIGYYHYAQQFAVNTLFDITADATSQANTFLNAITSQNLPKPDFPLVLDMENYTDKGQIPRYWSPIKTNNDAWIETFIAVLKSHGYDTMLYGGRYFFNDYTTNKFGNIPLWHAGYTSDPEQTNPTVARGWQKTGDKGIQNWVMWQFSSEGTLNGYIGNLDINAMKKSFFDSYSA